MNTLLHSHDSYFPEEAFDAELYDIEDDTFNALDGEQTMFGYHQFLTSLRTDAKEVVEELEGPNAKKLSLDTESLLADRIQAGIEARDIRDKEGEMYAGRLDTIILDSEQAKSQLVTANLPFAAYCARASMGLVTTAPVRVPSTTDHYYGFERSPGSMRKLSRLASPRASLEDRTQVAIEAMFNAADKYEGNRKARFITFAVMPIDQGINRYRASEDDGWYVSDGLRRQYANALEDQHQYGVYAPIRHLSVGGGKHDGLHPKQVFEGIQSVPIDTINSAANEEADIFDLPSPLAMEDIAPDPDASVTTEAVHILLQSDLMRVLDTLPEREANVIDMRYGLTDGKPKTLDEIATICGVTRVRIRQIESKAISRLRHPSRSSELRDYIGETGNLEEDTDVGSRILRPLASGAINLRTRRTPAGANTSLTTTPRAERDPGVETWQAYSGEPWDFEEAVGKG